MDPEPQNIEETKEAFLRSVRRFRFVSLLIFVSSGVAMLGIPAILVPAVSADHFKGFFEDRIGGDLGDGMRGLSFALLASPPWIAGMFWMTRRFNRSPHRCANCSAHFVNSGVAEFVVRENRCPDCDTLVFSEQSQTSDGQRAE